jgi:FRG domain
MIKPTVYKDWEAFFKKFFPKYSSLSAPTRAQLVFRGQADSRWALLPTLDRVKKYGSTAERELQLSQLISQFRQQARSLVSDLRPVADLEWELLGRHHGLPTSVLDFTRSPYVAAYFAFAEVSPSDSTHASIWVFNRDRFDRDPAPQIDIVDDEEQIRFNPRAQEQQGLFLKMKEVGPLEAVIPGCLERHDIPTGPEHRATALSTLDAMLITARSLFRDLDGAARTAALNVLVLA